MPCFSLLSSTSPISPLRTRHTLLSFGPSAVQGLHSYPVLLACLLQSACCAAQDICLLLSISSLLLYCAMFKMPGGICTAQGSCQGCSYFIIYSWHYCLSLIAVAVCSYRIFSHAHMRLPYIEASVLLSLSVSQCF